MEELQAVAAVEAPPIESPRLARHQSHMVESYRKEGAKARTLSKRLSADTAASLARGDELAEARRFKDAAEQYEFYVTANERKEDLQQLVAQGLLKLGRCQIKMDRLQEATDTIARCIRKAQALGDGTLAAHAYCEFGVALEMSGQFDGALKAYKRAFAQAKDSHDRDLEYKTIARIGGVFEATGKHMEAKRLYEKSIPHASTSRVDIKGAADLARRLARVLFDLERYAEAHEAYEDMRAATKKLEDQVGLGYAELGIADCCVAIGMKEEAVAALRRALPAFKSADFNRGVISATRRLAVALAAIGQDLEAFDMFEAVLSAKENGMSVFTGEEAMMLAQSWENIGRLDDALRMYRHAMKWFQQQDDPDTFADQFEVAQISAERIEISLRFSDGDLFDICASELGGSHIFADRDDDLTPRGRSRSRSNTNMRTGPALLNRLRRFFSDGKSPPGSKRNSPRNSSSRPGSNTTSPKPVLKQTRDDMAALPKRRRRRTISA